MIRLSLHAALRRRALLSSIVILLLAVAASTVYAAWSTIDTDDHVIDGNWSASTEKYTSTCSDGAINDKYEIAEGHLTNDGSNLYFRVDNCAIFSTGTGYEDLRIVAGIDCNNNGNVDDPLIGMNGQTGDRRIAYDPSGDVVLIYDGVNTLLGYYATIPEMGEQINDFPNTRSVWEWQMPLDDLYPACRGSVESQGIGFATADLAVEKDSTGLFTWSNPMDFGDAPTTYVSATNTCTGYDSLFPCDGPRHGMGDGLMLGAQIDPDGGGLQDDSARADDTDNVADEDGVEPSYGVVWSAGGAGSLDTLISGGSGYLNCWIDWNDDEDFIDSGEHVINETAVSAGAQTLSLAVPGSVDFTTGPVYSRCRLAPNTGEGNATTGPVWNGEVEDHLWLPEATTIGISLSTPNAIITWSHLTQNESYQVYRSTSPYFRLSDASALAPIVNANPWQYTDSGVAGSATDDNYFYVVVGRTDVDGTTIESTPSSEVGLFEFGLTPGVL